jgi:hypothetical protein
MKKRKFDSISYPKYTDYDSNIHKSYSNTYLQYCVHLCVLLDGPLLHTARSRIASGVHPDRIHVVERDPETFKKMTDMDLKINLHKGNMCDKIAEIKGLIGLLYLDYMGNVNNVSGFRKTLIACEKQLSKDSTIALTFSARFNKKNYTAEKFIWLIKNTLEELLPNRKIQTKLIRGYNRGHGSHRVKAQNMMFLVFSIDSDEEIIEEFRPRRVLKEMVLGADILKNQSKTGVSHVKTDEYYDKVTWYLFPKEYTWESCGTVLLE